MLKPDALADLMASDTPHAVLDVRERGALQRAHVFRTTTLPPRPLETPPPGCIPGSISVPGGELVLRIGELVERPETTIVVHCGGRTRSYIGAESLRRMRLPNPIVALENGTMGWELAGLTLERGANRTAPAPGSRSHVQAVAPRQRGAGGGGGRVLGGAEALRLWGGG